MIHKNTDRMYKISLSAEEIEKMPLDAFKGEISVISKPGRAFNEAISYLKKQPVLGFDTETRPVFDARQPSRHVALLQLSGPDRAFLFRIYRLGMPKQLCKILSNPEILKIGAACHDDVRGLQYYSKFESRSFIDLQKIVWQWGIRDKSVKKLAANILHIKISKAQQCSNWEADELTPAQQSYAATDAWVCLEMYTKLMGEEMRPLTQEQMYPPQVQQVAAVDKQSGDSEEAASKQNKEDKQ